jgi:ferredoxin
MKVVVDSELCEGHARCVNAAPMVFQVNEEDLAEVRDENVTAENESVSNLRWPIAPAKHSAWNGKKNLAYYQGMYSTR